jgi:diguanylate cyclase (GGDEF)-like protein
MAVTPDRPLITPFPEPGNRELIERLRWVIGLRWTVVIALLLVGFLGNTFRADSPQTSVVHVGLAVLVLTYNLAYLYAASRPRFGQSNLTTLIRYGQVPVDLLVFTVLIHFSGGVTGPVFVLYFLYIFVGLAILPPSGAYWVAGIAAFFYGLLTLIEAFWLPSATLSGEYTEWGAVYLGYFLTVAATLLITAYIANYFARLLTRDESTIRRQLDEMNTLYMATRKLSSTLNSDEVLRTLLSLSTEIEKPDAASVLIFDDQREGYLAATIGMTSEERMRAESAPITHAHPVVRQLLAGRKGVFAPNLEQAEGLRSSLVQTSARSFYSLPMYNDDRLVGSLNLSFDKPHQMQATHWNLLSALTQQAALAIERTRLFADAERAAREMTGLYHIGLATTSSLQIDEVLRLIYEQVSRAIRPDTFYIGLYDEDLGELRFDIFVENGEFLPPFRARVGDGISAWVIRNRRPVYVPNWSAEIEQLPFEAGMVGAPTQSVISVPLMAKNKMVGVMSVQAHTSNAFDHDHLRLLTSIAGQAALALENAKLHAQVSEQAQRDPLTGVFNHGTFIDKLHGVIRHANESGQAVALIMLDIDRFKQYNDTYGHMVGDDVLRLIVVAIQDHLKSTDIVGRWGGEEFGIILPDINRAQASQVADRIRQTAERTVLKDVHNRSIPSPTVSQGIALYPDDASNIEELIDKADSALYRAKDLGRNEIAEWIDMDSGRGPITFRARG